MERLTKRDEFGNADIIGVDSADLQMNLEFDEFNKVTDALNKLADYEDAEENGKLPKCKVGDTLFDISYQINDSGIAEFEVYKIELENGISYFLYCKELTSLRDRVTNSNFGNTVFLTREAAEAALEARES